MENLEQLLIKDAWITAEQLRAARQESQRCGKSIWSSLVKCGYVSLDAVGVFFAQHSGLSFVRPGDYKINPDVLRLIPEAYCRQHSLIPLFKTGETVYVAFSNTSDTVLFDAVGTMVRSLIEPLLATRKAIQDALDKWYGPEVAEFEISRGFTGRAALKGLGYWRQCERLPLSVPVRVLLSDSKVCSLLCSLGFDGITHDVSLTAEAVGLLVTTFVPRGVGLALEFRPEEGDASVIRAKGEIVHSHMENRSQYFLGVRLTQINSDDKATLIRLAGSQRKK